MATEIPEQYPPLELRSATKSSAISSSVLFQVTPNLSTLNVNVNDTAMYPILLIPVNMNDLVMIKAKERKSFKPQYPRKLASVCHIPKASVAQAADSALVSRFNNHLTPGIINNHFDLILHHHCFGKIKFKKCFICC